MVLIKFIPQSVKDTVPVAIAGPVAAVLALGVYFAFASYVSVLAAYALMVAIVGVLFWVSPRASLTLLFSSMFFQYFWIGVFLTPPGDYDLLGSLTLTNALIIYTVFFASLFYLAGHWGEVSVDLKRILLLALIFMIVVCIYAVLGIIRTEFGYVFTYLKTYSGAFLFIVIGAAYSLRVKVKDVLSISMGFGILMALYGYIEFIRPHETYTFVHMTEWMRFKYAAVVTKGGVSFPTLQSVVDYLTVSFLNLSGSFGLDFSMLRPIGPVFHFINFAYALAFCTLAAMMAGRIGIAIFLISMLVIIGSKGALILVFFPLLALILIRVSGSDGFSFKAILAALGLYTSVVFVYGSLSHDNHFLGLLAGIKGFLHNPLGHGVGIGGNASENVLNAKAAGADFKTDGSMVGESAIFVLLYQTGLLGFLSFFLYWKSLIVKTRTVFSGATDSLSAKEGIIIPVALAVLLANGLFQEEAFSPHAWGLWLILTGIAFSVVGEQPAVEEPEKKVPIYKNILRG